MKLARYGLFILAGLTSVAFAQTSTSPAASAPAVFTAAQQAAIQQVVHDYLIAHPEVLIEAGQSLQMKQQAMMQEQAAKVIPTLATSLMNDPNSPGAGNKAGAVSVIEFFDYQCPHCKSMGPEMAALIAQNKDVKVIYKELPIFGADSTFAAKAALASQKQGKFDVFHNALLNAPGRLTNQQVLDIAKSVGLDTNKLQADMNLPEYAKELQEVQTLAGKIGIAGTPGFIIMSVGKDGKVKSQFIPGQTTAAELAKNVNLVK